MGLLAEQRLSESLQELRVAVLATEDWQFTLEVFTVSGEPKIL
jgi:hypothetical protein